MTQENAEPGIFDALILLAENLKLLIAGPIVAGLLAFGFSFALPRSFVSQAVVNLAGATATPPAQVAAGITSPPVLDKAIESLQLGKEDAGESESLRKKLMGQIKVTAGKDGLLRLQVTASSPAQAQALANAVIDAWLTKTVPEGWRRSELERRLVYAQEALDTARRLRDRLTAAGGAGKAMTRGEVAALFDMADQIQIKRMEDVFEISGLLRGITREVVKLAPTLPVEPAAPRQGLTGLLAALITEFVLLLWLFARQTWRRAMQHPGMAAKQARLLAALGRKT